MNLPRLYVILEHENPGILPAIMRASCDAGARLFQLRQKDISALRRFRLASQLCQIATSYGAILLVNDRADIALSTASHGVHLPSDGLPLPAARRTLPDAVIGVSCHGLEDARLAYHQGADFITLSPFFSPSYAPERAPLARESFVESSSVHPRTFALGGIGHEQVEECFQTGVYGIAVLSGICAADDPFEATASYLDALDSART